MSRAPAVVAVGLCSCSGIGVDSAWRDVLSQTCRFKTQPLFDSPRYGDRLFAIADNFSTRWTSRLSRCARILLSSLEDAMKDVCLDKVDSDMVSVYFGTSIGGIFEAENMLSENAAKPSPDFRALSSYECSTLAELAAKRIRARGECATFSTACSSSTIALSAACDAISQGDCEVAVVCGADSLSRITVNGFGSLGLLSQDRCSPFGENRDGINLGEAGVTLVLASVSVVEKIGHTPLGYVSGWGCSCDAFHSTSPRPDGVGAARAMSETLRKAKISPSAIDYYCAHGTATRGNDASEAAALKKIFGENVPPFSSLKRIFAHTLGASGIVNAAMALKALETSTIPPNAGYSKVASDVGIIPQIVPQKASLKNAMAASIGFGGNNACAVFSRDVCVVDSSAPRRIFVYGYSEVGGTEGIDDSNLLPEIAPLKKRKWVHLQKMGLQVSLGAVNGLRICAVPERVSVCFGTGLGMTSQTAAFVENALAKRESEPMPAAFSNSVHNAVSSAVSAKLGFGGLNSATTAKEISFESALIQSVRDIRAGASDASIVGAADEYSPYIEKFMGCASKFSAVRAEFCDYAAAVFIGAEDSCGNPPLAELFALDIKKREFSPDAEFAKISALLAQKNLAVKDVRGWFALEPVNEWQQKYLASLSLKIGASFKYGCAKAGANYSASAKFVACALSQGRGVFVQYSLSSSSERSIFILEVK